jgi:hypothetical protein
VTRRATSDRELTPEGPGCEDMRDRTEEERHVATHRICEDAGCDTFLSRYNDAQFCALHQPMITPRMRGKVL